MCCNIFNFLQSPLTAECPKFDGQTNAGQTHTHTRTHQTPTRRNFDPKLTPPTGTHTHTQTPTATKCLIRSSAAPRSLSGHEISYTVAPAARTRAPTPITICSDYCVMDGHFIRIKLTIIQLKVKRRANKCGLPHLYVFFFCVVHKHEHV